MGMSMARVVTWIVAAAIGAVYGTAATVAHAFVIGWFPLGLILSIVGCGALLIALRALIGDRWAALAGGLGMLAAAWTFAQVSRGGSAIVAAATPELEWVPVVWSVSVPLVIALVVAWPDLSALRAAPGGDRGPGVDRPA